MTIELFGLDIAELVATSLSGQLLPAELHVRSQGDRDPNNLTAGRPITTVVHEGEGVTEAYSQDLIDGTLIRVNDRRIILIANSFSQRPVPKTGDKVLIESSLYTIVNVPERDPAGATYICQGRL